jgi:hypothetical protein
VSQGPNAHECSVDLTVYSGYQGSCVLRASTGAATCWSKSFENPSPPAGVTFSSIDVFPMGNTDFGGCGTRTTDGHPYCWAQHLFGASANPPEEELSSLSVGETFACGLRPNSKPLCWGWAGANSLALSPPEGSFKSLDSSPDGTCAVDLEGSIVCWGENIDWSKEPMKAAPTVPMKTVSMGIGYACGLTKDDQLECWGDASGNGRFLAAPKGKFTSVSVGHIHACALSEDHRVTCWGNDVQGSVSATPAGTFANVDAGVFHTCGVRLDTGMVQCWGDQGKEVPEDIRHPEPAAGGAFRLKHRESMECVHPSGGDPVPANGTLAVLFPACDNEGRLKFSLDANARLKQESSGKCLVPEDGSEMPAVDTPLVFDDRCVGSLDEQQRDRKTGFEFTSNGALRHIHSGLCVYPTTDPERGPMLELREGCEGSWLVFDRL